MSPKAPDHGGSAGFSLVEALVALAIAAVLTIALTRFVAGTRANAARVDEMLEMASLVDMLLTDLPGEKPIRAGRIEGRNGAFAWRVDIAPATFRTISLRVEKQTTAGVDVSRTPVKTNSDGSTLFRVTVVVQARSGRSQVVNTIRMGADPKE